MIKVSYVSICKLNMIYMLLVEFEHLHIRLLDSVYLGQPT